MTRAEHMAWAKARASEYVEAGDLNGAFASFTSDLGKHPETAGELEIQADLGMSLFVLGSLNSQTEMREWIEGFA